MERLVVEKQALCQELGQMTSAMHHLELKGATECQLLQAQLNRATEAVRPLCYSPRKAVPGVS